MHGKHLAVKAYRHESIQEAGVGFGRGLQALHGPLLHDGCHLGALRVQDAEPGHVDAAVPVRLHVQSEQVLEAPARGERGYGVGSLSEGLGSLSGGH